ncbi:helix-turn-helix domain-containing protein [Mucilaginibacter jinjuensis]|uniref:Helix-turn-helix transcriptional regulator n=1 Tax=Mucilaginibacter jinjuensis TaxID=1176721 RepID=A0ABY7TBD6_9SPHI|nr:helix-turn-helix transcriptional regulator [Mucilaginibacter jinjuensis]WCT13646.1 helix-turn-helix transcriptional regulator [Mucilaginibacter jinjuensis]
MSLGTRIKDLRIQKRLKQAELAEIVGLNSYVQIGRYETGKAKPAADMLSKLAKALDTTTDYLVNDDMNDAFVTAQLTDRELLKQFKEVEQFSAEDKQVVKIFIDAFITKRHIQELAK